MILLCYDRCKFRCDIIACVPIRLPGIFSQLNCQLKFGHWSCSHSGYDEKIRSKNEIVRGELKFAEEDRDSAVYGGI